MPDYDKTHAAEPEKNQSPFFESSLPRMPNYIYDTRSRVESDCTSGFRSGPPCLTKRATADKRGRQWKYKKQDQYDRFNRDEFYKDMLDRHTYFRKKHGIKPLEHDPNVNKQTSIFLCVK